MSTTLQKKPNVIVIIADQWSTKMADGSGDEGKLNTPGIDRLAEEGIRYEQSYSSYPLCCPARASLFTGLMPHNHGLIDNEEIIEHVTGEFPTTENFLAQTETMGEVFEKAGYDTGFFGKEHAAGYGWKGIEDFGSMTCSRGGYLAEGSVFDPIFTKDALDFIKRDRDNPFYMTLSFINPHDICKTLGGPVGGKNISDAIFFCRDDDEKYLRGQDRKPLPDNFTDRFISGMIKHEDYMYKELEELDENYWQQFISTYGLLIENTDWFIELVLETLKAQGLEEDTIVLFTADHGEMMGSHRLIAKTVFYEESVKTPMIIRYPSAVNPGKVDDNNIVSTIDIMPTLLDLCGLEVPKQIDGSSFKASMTDNAMTHEETFCESYFARMFRFKQYKYVESHVYGEDYQILIDLEKDPNETKNVFNQPGYEQVSDYASTRMKEWLKQEGIGLEFNAKNLKSKSLETAE
ncbi:sulfatase-like hydrolase/transferase [Photobacterium sp. BZF1]|uniref:sulfatase family protein n=1 Tax=Photobacterium sp. BZF1 TaxID=1904457 RepID=UPI001653BA5A|nr:sulfatase-like hydrolase/transferase [Photobacterium sp. BZF1]MBC7005436.1 sulfatase-like hydrolase/transferase [Photobacterium sp. BZF1]